MKKWLKILIISLSSFFVIIFTSLFFLLDIAFLFISNTNENNANYSIEGRVKVGSLSTQIELEIDGNKIKVEYGSLDFYIESVGSSKYIYTKNIFGKWSKTSITSNDEEKVAFLDLIGDLEREDFIFKTIGYYEMKQEKLDEENLESMNIKFSFEGILMRFKYSDNISYSILLKEFGGSKVNLPK